MNEIIRKIEAEQLKENAPEFHVGDTVKVYAKIKEGNRERIQVFEGTVLKRQGGGARETFTVRKTSNGIGVEKTWPVHSPHVERVEVVRRGKVRRAKLNYLRQRVGKAAKVKELVKFRKNNRRKKKKKPQMKKKNHLKFTNRSKKLKFEKKNYHITKNSLILAGEILCVCLVAVLLIAFFGHRVSNAGDAMSPTIENGEVVLVDRLIVDMKTPSRGTVVAFRPDGNREVHLLIRRIVGLPGETIQIKDGTVYINGKEQKKHIHVSEIKDAGIASDEIKLGKDEYFVLGDNEESGEDSRSETVGVIKADEIYGKVWFNVSSGEHFGFVKR